MFGKQMENKMVKGLELFVNTHPLFSPLWDFYADILEKTVHSAHFLRSSKSTCFYVMSFFKESILSSLGHFT